MLKIVLVLVSSFFILEASYQSEYLDYVQRYEHGKNWNIERSLQCKLAKQTLKKAKIAQAHESGEAMKRFYNVAVANWKETASKDCR